MQLAYPGTPVFHSIITSLMNPRTGGYIGDMPLPVRFLAVEMAHAWGVPSLGGGSFSSDAPDIGCRILAGSLPFNRDLEGRKYRSLEGSCADIWD